MIQGRYDREFSAQKLSVVIGWLPCAAGALVNVQHPIGRLGSAKLLLNLMRIPAGPMHNRTIYVVPACDNADPLLQKADRLSVPRSQLPWHHDHRDPVTPKHKRYDGQLLQPHIGSSQAADTAPL